MSHRMRRTAADRVAVQLIEAGVEAGFALIDEARAHSASGRPDFSSRTRQEAEDIFADVERRLQKLGDSESRHFHSLITELRCALAALERHFGGADGPAAQPQSDDTLPEG